MGAIILRTVLTVLLIIDCIAVCVIVLMQKGRDQGLGALSGNSGTYWEKNKSHSMEGRMILITRVLVVLFFILALLLNLKVF